MATDLKLLSRLRSCCVPEMCFEHQTICVTMAFQALSQTPNAKLPLAAVAVLLVKYLPDDDAARET